MRKILIGLLVCGVVLSACQPEPKPTGWTLLDTPTHPPATYHSGFAYDTYSQEGVVFGGGIEGGWSDETWIWDGSHWRQAGTSIRPVGREKMAMAYDEARDRIVLFGGATDKTIFADTWEWDGSAWLLKSPPHTPPARCCHALAYDSVQQKVLLYGGVNTLTGEFFNDTWAWDGSDWTEVTCCSLPLLAGHSLVSFGSRGEVILVPSSAAINTWAWDGDDWTEIPAYPDPPRVDSRSAYDGQYDRVVLFGGFGDDQYSREAWVFDGQAWNYIALTAQLPARFGHVFFYDTKRQSFIVFGGASASGKLADTWELTLPADLSARLLAVAPTEHWAFPTRVAPP